MNHDRARELVKRGKRVKFEGPGALSAATYIIRSLGREPGGLFNVDFQHDGTGCPATKEGQCRCDPTIWVQRVYASP